MARGGNSGGDRQLRIMSFNVNRSPTDLDAEARVRDEAIIDLILAELPDVLCLQGAGNHRVLVRELAEEYVLVPRAKAAQRIFVRKVCIDIYVGRRKVYNPLLAIA